MLKLSHAGSLSRTEHEYVNIVKCRKKKTKKKNEKKKTKKKTQKKNKKKTNKPTGGRIAVLMQLL